MVVKSKCMILERNPSFCCQLTKSGIAGKTFLLYCVKNNQMRSRKMICLLGNYESEFSSRICYKASNSINTSNLVEFKGSEHCLGLFLKINIPLKQLVLLGRITSVVNSMYTKCEITFVMNGEFIYITIIF